MHHAYNVKSTFNPFEFADSSILPRMGCNWAGARLYADYSIFQQFNVLIFRVAHTYQRLYSYFSAIGYLILRVYLFVPA